MTSVEVLRTTEQTSAAQNPQHKRMTILSEGGTPELTVPFAPKEVTHTDLVPGYTELDRAKGAPLLHRNQPKNRKQSFVLFFGHRSLQNDVTTGLNKLINISQSSKRVRIKYGTFETGLWRVSTLTINSSERNLDGEISRATVTIELTAVVGEKATAGNGPVSGGTSTSGGSSKGGKAIPRYYTVKKGDTLKSIALKFYKDATMWKPIADLNKIKDPKKIKVGTKLRLPVKK